MREPSLKGAEAPVVETLRVLLVEDSENDAMLLLRELRRGGYEPLSERVYTPEDMERALRAADERGEPFQIVISDYYMPRFRAPEALELLRGLGSDVPFIVVSGKIGEDAAVGIMKAGADDYLTKENMSRLCPAIERELREAEVRRERERAEEALGRSEDRFRRLVEQAADAIFVHDLDGNFVDVNRQACESLGYTREELLSMSVADVEKSYEQGSLQKLWEQITSGPPRTLEGIHRRKDGSTFPVEVRVGVFEAEERPLMLALIRDASRRREAERKIRETEARYRTLVEQIPAVTYVQEPIESENPKAITYMSPQYEAMLGYPPDRETLDEEHWLKVLHPDDRERVLAEERRTDETGEPFKVEYRQIARDGRVVWVRDEATLLRDEEGNPLYWLGVQYDITEQKHTQEELRQSEERFKVLAEEVVEGLILIENGKIIDANRSLTEMFGYELDELIGKDATELTLPENREMVRRRIFEEDTRPYESRGLKKDGTVFPLEIRPRHLPYSGRRIRVTSVIDLTERKRMEDAVRESEERFRALVQNASDIILVLDAEGTILYESPAVERVLGYSAQERVGINAFDQIHPDDRAKILEVFSENLSRPGPFPPVEYRVRDRKGAWRHLEAIGENLLHDPIIKGVVVNSRDVTERRRTEEALKESEARLQAILDNTTAVVYVKDEEGRYSLINHRFEEIFRVSGDQVLGKTDHDLFTKEAADVLRANDEGVFRSGVPLEAEEVVPQEDGTHTYFSVKVPLRDQNGTTYAICGISTDITERKRAEEALVMSEERYRAVVEQSAEGIYLLDARSKRILETNPALRDMLGYSAAELRGMELYDITAHPQEDVDMNVERTLAERSRFAGERRYLRKDGSIVEVEVGVSVIQYGGMEVICAVLRDITERKRAEARYRTLVEQLPAVTYMQDIEGAALAYVSPQIEGVLGYSPEEYLADPSLRSRTIHPEDREWVLAEDERTDETGDPYSVEYRRIARDGRVLWVREEAVLVRDSEGAPLFWQGILMDVTERKRQEEALRQSEALYRTVVEQAAENIFLVDVNTRRVLEANDALHRSLGYTAEELKEMTLYDIVAHEQESVDLNIERIMEEGRQSLGERQYRRKDGSLADVEVNVSAVPYGEKRVMCIVAHDVTERKRAERALEEIREAERNRIARELHDGTLQDIVYALQEVQVMQVVAGEDENPALEDTAEALRRSVEGLRGAIFELRLKETLNRSLASSLESLLDLNRRMSRGRYELKLIVDDDFPSRLPDKKGQELTRLVQEALTNVRRHAEAAHVRVELGIDGELAYVEVSDDGRGFDSESARTGMGTQSMSQRALELGGELAVQSAPGEGTRVRFTISLSRLVQE